MHCDEEKEAFHAMKYLQARARNLVSDPKNWRKIEDFGSALLERQILFGQEVKAVPRSSGGWNQPDAADSHGVALFGSTLPSAARLALISGFVSLTVSPSIG